MPDVFDLRVRRATFLENEWPFAAELLSFFKEVYRLQSRLYQDLERAVLPAVTISETLHVLSPLLDLVEQRGPAFLRPQAGPLRTLDRESWERRSLAYLEQRRLEAGPEDFVLRILLEPCSRLSRERQSRSQSPDGPTTTCPACGTPPLVSLLREDKHAETVRRSLICSLCSHEWDFPRVLCPKCKEERPEKLPRYTAQEIAWMRVEACDTCGTYLKCVDLAVNWEAEPIVDELASMPLDVIAAEHAYTKLAPNLAGL